MSSFKFKAAQSKLTHRKTKRMNALNSTKSLVNYFDIELYMHICQSNIT